MSARLTCPHVGSSRNGPVQDLYPSVVHLDWLLLVLVPEAKKELGGELADGHQEPCLLKVCASTIDK